jgi:hypothetical protein
MERRKNHGNYVFHCVSKRTLPDYCNGNHIREDSIRVSLFNNLIQLKDELLVHQEMPVDREEIIPELSFLDMEMHGTQSLLRSLYENFVTGTISKSEYMKQQEEHRTKADKAKERAAYLQRLLDDDKIASKRKQQSLQIINMLKATSEVTAEHIERFVSRIIIFRDGRVHFDLENG